MNEMEHKGNWSPPIADEGYILVPSNEGFINKFFKDDGTRVSGWQYPQSENSLGSFYGHMVLNDGVLFGSGYGNGEGKRCQNRKCISNIFAIDIESSQSIWMEGMLKIDGSIVGGLVSHENIIYFAKNTTNFVKISRFPDNFIFWRHFFVGFARNLIFAIHFAHM